MRYSPHVRLIAAVLHAVGFGTAMPMWAANPESPATRTRTTVQVDRQTGRLVRSVAVTPRLVQSRVVSPSGDAALAGPAVPEKIRAVVAEKSRQHGVDPLLVHSVIQVESAYNPYAVSPKGAEGLMQLIPDTARRYGVRNSFDIEQNIEGGVRYLRDLVAMFGDERLALAAYNAGEGAVKKYGWIPPYAETQNYVYEVGRRYGHARREAAARPSLDALAAPGDPAVPQKKAIQEFVDSAGRVHIVIEE